MWHMGLKVSKISMISTKEADSLTNWDMSISGVMVIQDMNRHEFSAIIGIITDISDKVIPGCSKYIHQHTFAVSAVSFKSFITGTCVISWFVGTFSTRVTPVLTQKAFIYV